MDKLDTIFAMQKGLDEEIASLRNLDYPQEIWIQKGVLAMVSELAEVLDEVNFKWWKNPRELDDSAVKEELVDVLHFFIGMCIHSGMTADELFEIYRAKNQENYDRQHGISEKKGYEVS